MFFLMFPDERIAAKHSLCQRTAAKHYFLKELLQSILFSKNCIIFSMHCFTWPPWPVFSIKVDPNVSPSQVDSTFQAVKCWVSFSLVANDHQPFWVGAALSGPSRHCLHGSQHLDSPALNQTFILCSLQPRDQLAQTWKQGETHKDRL